MKKEYRRELGRCDVLAGVVVGGDSTLHASLPGPEIIASVQTGDGSPALASGRANGDNIPFFRLKLMCGQQSFASKVAQCPKMAPTAYRV